ncbi:quinone oxidoreductase [Aneurinibacillus migulanus]|uniref:NADPH:quinone oxidoreductase family protein n=1 Tax=Aneurinibacillus migulanus TaxID=47500 RepID=UPI0005BD2488|nr:acryloyl-CoA reductase [Aneurinibacillus migulanus]KIV50985.1 quinone oxidoreductase [Aneurinibacillus migulanus]KPD09129.1 quinone oxidoreductase [Aneurinibacillus migulanus]
MQEKFRALVVDKAESGDVSTEVRELSIDQLPKGEVTIRAAYSSVNYKDGLASIPNGNIARMYPLILGIDVAGTVVTSSDARFKEGDNVLVTGFELGVAHYGGFSEYVRVPAEWVVPLPSGLTLKEAMAYGTAGFTAALSVQRLEESGVTPEEGEVLVTGATGGVGSLAVAMLAEKGYDVVASTGKDAEHGYLRELGVKEIVTREEMSPETFKPIGKPRWAGAVDPVGGKTLAYILSTTKYGGAVAVSGLTGGTSVPTSVFPFILRGVNLLGIDSVYCPMKIRLPLWERMANDLKPNGLEAGIVHEITLNELPQTLACILQGQMRGRAIVKL